MQAYFRSCQHQKAICFKSQDKVHSKVQVSVGTLLTWVIHRIQSILALVYWRKSLIKQMTTKKAIYQQLRSQIQIRNNIRSLMIIWFNRPLETINKSSSAPRVGNHSWIFPVSKVNMRLSTRIKRQLKSMNISARPSMRAVQLSELVSVISWQSPKI